MDRKTFQQVALARIEVASADIPKEQRDYFVQDMWVHMLGADVYAVFERTHAEDPTTSIGSFLNITIFRARQNWLDRQRFRDQGHAIPTDPGSDLFLDIPSDDAPDVRIEAEQALTGLIASLEAADYTQDEINTVVDGLREGLTKAEIARSVGRSPQSFGYFFTKSRLAAA
jgi:hypothetical protein